MVAVKQALDRLGRQHVQRQFAIDLVRAVELHGRRLVARGLVICRVARLGAGHLVLRVHLPAGGAPYGAANAASMGRWYQPLPCQTELDGSTEATINHLMTNPSYRHVAFTVPDLESAEAYYRRLFDLDVLTREALTAEGDRQLPKDKDWDDARRAGIDLYMVGLRRGRFVLALFDEASPASTEWGGGQRRPLFVGLVMDADEMDALRGRLGSEEEWDDDSGGFRDRYGIVWQPSTSDRFVGSGERTGQWLG